jgi:hypothetical protein
MEIGSEFKRVFSEDHSQKGPPGASEASPSRSTNEGDNFVIMTIKFRSNCNPKYKWDAYTQLYKVNGVSQPTSGDGKSVSNVNEVQRIVSEGHPFRLIGEDAYRNWDIGGPFESRKVEIHLDTHRSPMWLRLASTPKTSTWEHEFYGIPTPDSEFSRFQTSTAVEGPQTEAQVSSLLSGAPSRTQDSDLDAWGTSVIGSIAPTNPISDLSVSIGELLGERRFFALPGKAENLSGEYLNYMFGIAPTISDVQNFRDTAKKAEKLIDQYTRDSGRLVRRSFTPDPDITTEKLPDIVGRCSSLGIGGQVRIGASGNGTLKRIRKTTKTWKFSGAFTYYLPKEALSRRISELDHLYGILPGAGTAWELIPFSWLVDYFSSIGDAMQNFDNFARDGLVMPYAYVQRSVKIETEYTWTGPLNRGVSFSELSAVVPTVVSGRIVTHSLQRRPATPFGFGVSASNLTLRQASIIAALGISSASKL